MRAHLRGSSATLGLLLAGCVSFTGPSLITEDGLVLELITPTDTVAVGDQFALTIKLRNEGRTAIDLSGGWCLARHTVRLGGREVSFPLTGRGLTCGSAIWSLTLAPGEEKLDVVETVANLGTEVRLPADLSVETEFFFTVRIGTRSSPMDRELRDTFVIGPRLQ